MTEKLKSFDYCYLATTYRQFPRGPDMAAIEAARLVVKLHNLGVITYSPIVHGHQLTVHGKIRTDDYTLWREMNLAMLKRMDALIVAMMEGWERSEGIADEVSFAKAERKPVFYLDPETMQVNHEMDIVDHDDYDSGVWAR